MYIANTLCTSSFRRILVHASSQHKYSNSKIRLNYWIDHRGYVYVVIRTPLFLNLWLIAIFLIGLVIRSVFPRVWLLVTGFRFAKDSVFWCTQDYTNKKKMFRACLWFPIQKVVSLILNPVTTKSLLWENLRFGRATGYPLQKNRSQDQGDTHSGEDTWPYPDQGAQAYRPCQRDRESEWGVSFPSTLKAFSPEKMQMLKQRQRTAWGTGMNPTGKLLWRWPCLGRREGTLMWCSFTVSSLKRY
jgi:hypothetical protein